MMKKGSVKQHNHPGAHFQTQGKDSHQGQEVDEALVAEVVSEIVSV